MTITFLGAVDLVAHCKFQPAVIQHGMSLYRQFVLHYRDIPPDGREPRQGPILQSIELIGSWMPG